VNKILVILVILVTTGLLFTGTAYAITNLGDHVSVPSGSRYHLDGTDTGDTYFREAPPDNIRYVAGGSVAFDLDATTSPKSIRYGTGWSMSVGSGDRIYVDGLGDTYFREASPNRFGYVVGGSSALDMDANTSPKQVIAGVGWAMGVRSAERIFVDGGGDTYLRESVANNIRYVVGGSSALDMNANTSPKQIMAGTGWAMGVRSTEKIFLDGGGDTFLRETSANSISIVAGGSTKATFSSGDICIGTCP